MCAQGLPQAVAFPVGTWTYASRVIIRKVHGPKKDFLVPYKNEYEPLVWSLHVYAVWTLLQNTPPDMTKWRNIKLMWLQGKVSDDNYTTESKLLGRSGLYRIHYSMTSLTFTHLIYIYIYKSNNIKLRLIVHERIIQLKRQSPAIM